MSAAITAALAAASDDFFLAAGTITPVMAFDRAAAVGAMGDTTGHIGVFSFVEESHHLILSSNIHGKNEYLHHHLRQHSADGECEDPGARPDCQCLTGAALFEEDHQTGDAGDEESDDH